MATTEATVTDVERLEQIHTDLDRRSLLPGEHIVDAGHVCEPSFVNRQALPAMSEGGIVADVIAALASVDPVKGGCDR